MYEYELDIKRNKIHVKGSIYDIESLNLIGWKMQSSDTASFDLDVDSFAYFKKKYGNKCKPSQKVIDWYTQEYYKRERALNAHNKSSDFDLKGLNKELRGYQLQAINYFKQNLNAIIAYKPGLGKTLIAINCIKVIKAKKVLVVVPSYLKYNFAQEIEKWSPELTYTIVDGTPAQREIQFDDHKNRNRNILIINYEQIRIKVAKNGKVLAINVHKYIQETEFDMTIWDESHRIKNHKSQIYQGAKAINTKARLMLTGTPTSKNTAEIWGNLSILDRKRFKAYWTFVEFFNHVKQGDYGGLDILSLKRPKEYKKLVNQYMLLKTKEEVAPELPEKIFIDIPVYMGTKQLNYYNKAKEEFLKPDDDIIESPVERFIRLCQITQNPVILDGDDVSVTRDTTLDIIEDIGEQRILIGCLYVKMSKNLHTSISEKYKNRNVYLIHSSIKDRHKIVEEFKKDKTGILVTTIKCLMEGANIDECHNIIYTDIEWNCGVNEQFENRIHRLTSTRKKTYYRIIVQNTVHAYKVDKIDKEEKEIKGSLGASDQKIIRNIMNEWRNLEMEEFRNDIK